VPRGVEVFVGGGVEVFVTGGVAVDVFVFVTGGVAVDVFVGVTNGVSVGVVVTAGVGVIVLVGEGVINSVKQNPHVESSNTDSTIIDKLFVEPLVSNVTCPPPGPETGG